LGKLSALVKFWPLLNPVSHLPQISCQAIKLRHHEIKQIVLTIHKSGAPDHLTMGSSTLKKNLLIFLSLLYENIPPGFWHPTNMIDIF